MKLGLESGKLYQPGAEHTEKALNSDCPDNVTGRQNRKYDQEIIRCIRVVMDCIDKEPNPHPVSEAELREARSKPCMRVHCLPRRDSTQ